MFVSGLSLIADITSVSLHNALGFNYDRDIHHHVTDIELSGTVSIKGHSAELLINGTKPIRKIAFNVHLSVDAPRSLVDPQNQRTKHPNMDDEPAITKEIGWLAYDPELYMDDNRTDLLSSDAIRGGIFVNKSIYDDIWMWARGPSHSRAEVLLTIFGSNIARVSDRPMNFHWKPSSQVRIAEFRFSTKTEFKRP